MLHCVGRASQRREGLTGRRSSYPLLCDKSLRTEWPTAPSVCYRRLSVGQEFGHSLVGSSGSDVLTKLQSNCWGESGSHLKLSWEGVTSKTDCWQDSLPCGQWVRSTPQVLTLHVSPTWPLVSEQAQKAGERLQARQMLSPYLM